MFNKRMIVNTVGHFGRIVDDENITVLTVSEALNAPS